MFFCDKHNAHFHHSGSASPDAINGELNNGESEDGTLVDIDEVESVESSKGDVVENVVV